MIDRIPAGPSVRNEFTGGVSSIDYLTCIQILMVQDYDDQLRSIGSQMKGIARIKKGYRNDIQKLQEFLMRRGEERNGDGTKSETVKVTPYEFNDVLNKSYEYLLDGNGELDPVETTLFGNIEAQATVTDRGRVTGYYVTKEAIEKKMEGLKMKLESFNEQSEIIGIEIQGLTNQRKIAFETVSNLLSKHYDSLSTIVRNMKG